MFWFIKEKTEKTWVTLPPVFLFFSPFDHIEAYVKFEVKDFVNPPKIAFQQHIFYKI